MPSVLTLIQVGRGTSMRPLSFHRPLRARQTAFGVASIPRKSTKGLTVSQVLAMDLQIFIKKDVQGPMSVGRAASPGPVHAQARLQCCAPRETWWPGGCRRRGDVAAHPAPENALASQAAPPAPPGPSAELAGWHPSATCTIQLSYFVCLSLQMMSDQHGGCSPCDGQHVSLLERLVVEPHLRLAGIQQQQRHAMYLDGRVTDRASGD